MKSKNLYVFTLTQFLWISGGLFFFEGYSSLFIPIFFFTSLVFYFKTNTKKNEVLKSNLKILCLFIFWIIITSFIVNGPPVDNLYVSTILLPLSTLLIVSSSDFDLFREKLLRVLNIILILSLIVHFLHNFGILPASNIEIGNTSGVMSLCIFHTEWGSFNTFFGEFYRFSAIYWEAGQLQIVLTYILVLFSDQIKSHVSDLRYILKKFGVVIFSLLLTGSTTGYLVFMLFVIVIVSLSLNKRNRKYFPLHFLFMVVLSLVIFNSKIVQEKFAQKDDLSGNTSYIIRMKDNLACLEVSLEHPLLGLGFSSERLYSELSDRGSASSSNGWLRTSASLGITMLVFILFFMYRGLKKMGLGIPPLCLICVLVLSQANEYYTFYPYLFMYIFRFKSYKHVTEVQS